ncbi:uncharacterized protein LOC115832893 [Nomascus leucogenys]|uniref:uncharacterized protein LOC115832893 n=1 Tax=Nomascus leucogenys TaxID=61853 RepID=UPI00122D88BF|nr:uncharacterized protein LOC115832893 [Nomascus leucogenys]
MPRPASTLGADVWMRGTWWRLKNLETPETLDPQKSCYSRCLCCRCEGACCTPRFPARDKDSERHLPGVSGNGTQWRACGQLPQVEGILAQPLVSQVEGILAQLLVPQADPDLHAFLPMAQTSSSMLGMLRDNPSASPTMSRLLPRVLVLWRVDPALPILVPYQGQASRGSFCSPWHGLWGAQPREQWALEGPGLHVPTPTMEFDTPVGR